MWLRPQTRADRQSLIRSHARGDRLAADRHALRTAIPAYHDLAPDMTTQIGRYRNLQPIGRGGMGEIFRAEDPSLQRDVALKFITREHADEGARLRIMREARAAAGLSHPFVCTVHEVLEVGNQPVIVMELVVGETLHERLKRGPPAPDETRRIAGEILEALAAAHERGIIHRDIKSSNIMLTADGHVKVMDFGLATTDAESDSDATVERLTAAGALSGTITHLAPEILRGGMAGVSSDLYAVGVTLYEMCAGRLPFVAPTSAALIGDVLYGAPPLPPSRHRPAAPPALDQFVMSLIERDPACRPSGARAAVELLRRATESSPQPATCSVAVLPFRPLLADAESEILSVALADATITELSMLRSLTVRPTGAIVRYLSGGVDPVTAGRETGVDVVVHGTFQRSGGRLRVTVQLVRTAEARSIWATKIDTSLEDIFATQDEISRRIAEALHVELSPDDRKRMARVEQPSGAAYEKYLEGQLHLFRETLPDTNAAIDAFRKTVEIDPSFAAGWAALAEAYVILGYSFDPNPAWFERAADLTERALALDPKLPEGRYLQARLIWNPGSGFDHAAALRHLAAAIAGKPNLAQAHDWMATVLQHVGLLEESRMHLLRAIDIAPDDVNAKLNFGFFLLFEGRYDEALEVGERFSGGAPMPVAHYLIAAVHLREGRYELAQQTADRAAREFRDVYFHPLRAILAAVRGDGEGLHSAIDATVANARAFGHFHHAQYDIACAHAIAGNPGEAVRWLTEAARNGFPSAGFIERDPLLAQVRDTAEARALCDALRREQEHYAIIYREAMTSPFSDSRRT
jgi:eukaryotic-like serine/threonine-protein kinase